MSGPSTPVARMSTLPLSHGSPEGNMDINVVLAAQSLSFPLSVNPSSTIADLKQLVRDNCTGRPLPSGQRIIFKGRVLLDSEVVGDLLKPLDIKHTLHVAVHPAAWASPPPSQPDSEPSTSSTPSPPPASATATLPVHSLPTHPQILQITASVHLPQQLILHQHTNAIRILSKQPLQPWLGPGDYRSARNLTKAVLAGANIGWPPNRILDDDIFVKYTQDPSSSEPGVTYTWQVINNLPYLALVEGQSESPTSIQLRALEILTHTYPLLPVLPTLPPFSNPTMSVLQSIQNVVNRRRPGATGTSPVGLNPVPLPNQAQNGNNQPQVVWQAVIRQQRQPGVHQRLPLHLTFSHQIFTVLLYLLTHPTRVLIPVILILARAAFMVYILDCPPSKHPYWFMGVVGWALWEIYKVGLREGERFVRIAGIPVRAEDGHAGQQPAQQPAAAQGDPPANQAQPQQGQDGAQPPAADAGAGAGAPQPPAPGPAFPPQRTPRGRFAALFDILAVFHLPWEQGQLGVPLDSVVTNPGEQANVGPASVPPHDLVDPSISERAKVFVAMFVYSIFPGVWARRLSLLRMREGRVREVYGRGWRGDEPVEIVEEEQPPQPAQQPAEGENGEAEPAPTPPADAPRDLEAEAREKVARQRLLTGWRREYVKRVLGADGDDVMGMIDD